MEPSEVAEVRRTMEAIQAAWVGGTPDEMRPHLHPAMVVAPPGASQRARGADAVVQSFADFLAATETLAFEPGPLEIDVIGDSAVAVLPFVLRYGIGGQRFVSRGRDLWMFQRGPAGWLAVWRTLVDPVDERVGSYSPPPKSTRTP